MAKTTERIPEPLYSYNDEKESKVYYETSRNWPFTIIEKGFVDDILWAFGKKPRLKVLDLGTGPGWIPTMLATARPQWEISALDYSGPMLARAAARSKAQDLNINWIRSSAESIPIKTGEYDLILSHFSFSEFSDPDSVFKEMRRILKENGMVCIQDLRRPNQLTLKLILGAVAAFHLTRPIMKQQVQNSFKGAYTTEEMAALVNRPGFFAHIDTRWSITGPLIRTWLKKSAF